MFYAAEALLNERGLRFRKRGDLYSALGRHFVRTGEMDAKYHEWLLAAFEKRVAGDYGIGASLTAEEAEALISQARQFPGMAQRYLRHER